MELIFRKEDMAVAMKTVGKAVGKSSIPILTNVLISAAYDPLPGLLRTTQETDSGIYLAATDLEIGIRASVPGQVVESGAIALPAREFAGMIRETSNMDIHLITSSGGRVRVECGSAQFRIAGLPADEFPSLVPESDSETQPDLMGDAEDESQPPTVSMDSGTLASMIGMTSFAVSRDEVRHFLNGVHLSLRNDSEGNASGCLVTMAATDGTRLAVATARAEEKAEEEKGVIIPIKVIAQLRSMLPRSDMVQIGVHDSRIAFDVGNVIVVSRLIDDEYPDYTKVIPKESGIKLTMDTQRLLSVCKRVATMANPKLPGVKMEAAGDVLRMSSSTPEFGEAYEEMRIEKEGDDIGVGLNVKYLMDALKVIQGEEVMIGIDEPLKPVLIKPVSDNGYLYVLMPVRL